MPEVRQALCSRGYILVIIGGGITGFVQVNGIHLHKPLKSEYQKKVPINVRKVTKWPTEMSTPDQSEMMRLLVNSNILKVLRLMSSLLSSQFGLHMHLLGQRVIWSVAGYLFLLLNRWRVFELKWLQSHLQKPSKSLLTHWSLQKE